MSGLLDHILVFIVVGASGLYAAYALGPRALRLRIASLFGAAGKPAGRCGACRGCEPPRPPPA